jgi:hypothetical protein
MPCNTGQRMGSFSLQTWKPPCYLAVLQNFICDSKVLQFLVSRLTREQPAQGRRQCSRVSIVSRNSSEDFESLLVIEIVAILIPLLSCEAFLMPKCPDY